MRPEPSTEEVEDFIAFLVRVTAQPSHPYTASTAHLIGRDGIVNVVRICLGDVAAAHAARTLPLH